MGFPPSKSKIVDVILFGTAETKMTFFSARPLMQQMRILLLIVWMVTVPYTNAMFRLGIGGQHMMKFCFSCRYN